MNIKTAIQSHGTDGRRYSNKGLPSITKTYKQNNLNNFAISMQHFTPRNLHTEVKCPKFIKLKSKQQTNDQKINCILRKVQSLQTGIYIEQLPINNQKTQKNGVDMIIKTMPNSPRNFEINYMQNYGKLIYKNKSSIFPSFLKTSKIRTKQKLQQLNREKFKLIKKIGQGKNSEVYLAIHKQSGLVVALKIFSKKSIKQQNHIEQFIKQIKIQYFINHPNIISLYGWFKDQFNFYIVMELGSDGYLYRLLKKNISFTEQTVSYISKNLLSAVNELHKHNIIHRDIKPQNIVLILGNLKLCDFGEATKKNEELRWTFCGTPLYFSPELLSGQSYDEKVDLWATGILIYQLHIGRYPFKIKDKSELCRIITDEVQFPNNWQISQEFKNFVCCLLRKDPSNRIGANKLLLNKFITQYQHIQTCQQLCKQF